MTTLLKLFYLFLITGIITLVVIMSYYSVDNIETHGLWK